MNGDTNTELGPGYSVLRVRHGHTDDQKMTAVDLLKLDVEGLQVLQNFDELPCSR